MRRSGLALSVVGALVALAAFPGRSRADGMPFAEVTATDTEVRATAQRAVVWLRGGTWEVHIQPVFDREQGRAAWVVPWPSQPTIHESSAALFDQLELLTTPVFVDYCTPASEDSVGCMASDQAGSGNGDSELRSASADVTVWDSGTVGQLDYVVLSAATGDSLAGWLDGNGFAMSTAAASAIAEYDVEEQFFFVARLSAESDPAGAIDPVRFVLPDETDGYYPMRLTSLAVGSGDLFDLTLWVVFPDSGSAWLPASHPWALLGGQPTSRDAFDAAVDGFFDDHTPDHLLLQYASSPEYHYDLLSDTRMRYTPYVHISYEELGLDAPAVWAPELQEIAATNGTRIHRYQARMDALAMNEDLVFTQADWSDVPVKDCFYFHDTGTCEGSSEDDDYVGCSVVRSSGISSWFLPALGACLILLLLGGLARRRRR